MHYFSRPVAGRLSHSRLGGTKGARVYTTSQMRAPAEVRGACSRPPKSQILANIYGESFRPTRAEQDIGDPTILKIYGLLLAAAVSCLITPFLELSTEASHGTATVVHQALPL